MHTKRIGTNTFWLTLAEVGSKALVLVFTILLARYIQASGYGQYTFATSLVSFFAILIDFGFHPLYVRDVAQHPERERTYISTITGLKVLATLVAIVALWASRYWWHTASTPDALVWIMAGYAFANSFGLFFRSIFIAKEQMHWEAVFRIMEKVLYALFVVVVIVGHGDVFAAGWALAASTLITLLATLVLLYKQKRMTWPHIDPTLLKPLLHEALFFVMSSIFIKIYFRIDTVMLAHMTNDTSVGLYNAAYDIVFALVLVPTIFSQAVYPSLARAAKNGITHVRQQFGFLLQIPFLAAGLTFFFLFFGAHLLITTLYGATYTGAIALFQTLSFVVLIVFLSQMTVMLLNALGKQRLVTVATAVAMVFNILLNLLLIPKFGAQGSAVATIATEGLVLATTLIFLHRVFGWGTRRATAKIIRGIIGLGIAGFCGVLVLYTVPQPLGALIAWVASSLVFIGLAVVTNIFGKREWQLLQHLHPAYNSNVPDNESL